MRRGATAGAALLLAAAGCGGGGGGGGGRASIPAPPSQPAATASVPAPGASSGDTEVARKTAAARARRRRATQPASSASARRALARLPASQREQTIVTSARVVFSRFGFASPVVTATAGGRDLQALLSAAEACQALPGTDAHVAGEIRQAVPTVQSVQIGVGPARQPLAAYVRGHCPRLALPAGRGRVALVHDGVGVETTKAFTVHSSRWTVEYLNGSGYLSVFVTRRSRPVGQGLAINGRGAGRRTVDGGGTFALRVVGVGEWIVRVRDGA